MTRLFMLRIQRLLVLVLLVVLFGLGIAPANADQSKPDPTSQIIRFASAGAPSTPFQITIGDDTRMALRYQNGRQFLAPKQAGSLCGLATPLMGQTVFQRAISLSHTRQLRTRSLALVRSNRPG